MSSYNSQPKERHRCYRLWCLSFLFELKKNRHCLLLRREAKAKLLRKSLNGGVISAIFLTFERNSTFFRTRLENTGDPVKFINMVKKTTISTITFSILGSNFLHQNQAPPTNLLTVFQHRCRLRHASKVLSNKNYSTGVDGRLSISHP